MTTILQSPARDQDKVWEYYQTKGVEIFDYAVPRLNYLFQQARNALRRRRSVKVLNIGIGNGWLERRCHAAGWETYSLDPNEIPVAMLRADGIQAMTGGIEALPFPDASFDVVFVSEVLEHLLDDILNSGLREISRVLKPSGLLLGSVPCRENLVMRQVVCPSCDHVHHAFGHHQSFSAARLLELFSKVQLRPLYFRNRAFPGFRRRNLAGKFKSVVWVIAGRFGAAAADAKIVFAASR